MIEHSAIASVRGIPPNGGMDKVLHRRTASSYASHKRRAAKAGQVLDYTLDHLRKRVEGGIYCPCKYCKCLLIPDNFACDHATPTSRGGSFSLYNVEVICGRCNLAKGILSGEAFAELWDAMSAWHPAEVTDLLARLRAGGRRYRAR